MVRKHHFLTIERFLVVMVLMMDGLVLRIVLEKTEGLSAHAP
jgi:hypothetical protein